MLALDQGTTSSRAILFDHAARPVSVGQSPLRRFYPQAGWVEQDANEIWSSQWQAIEQCLQEAKCDTSEIAAIGIANQRETTVVWDRRTGKPLYNAIVWQCRRTAPYCTELKESGLEAVFRQKTGLRLDPYFSGTKIAWLLNTVSGLRDMAERGEVAVGTVDSWLMYLLSGQRRHLTDVSNAARTLLYNIHTLRWDDELLQLLNVPEAVLPRVVDSSGAAVWTSPQLLGKAIPISGIAGDQQAALFGNGCFDAGSAKNTYGTGCFLLMNTGDVPVNSAHGLISTVAWRLNGRVQYALEGSIFIAGALVQWLRDGLQIIPSVEETERLALSVADTGGVVIVPAFAGLGSPYWDSSARGLIIGLTQGTTREHIVRAALEAIAHQTADVVEAINHDHPEPLTRLRTDGNAIRNRFLAQFQADILGIPVVRPLISETTALGAAFLAGLGVGFWDNLGQIAQMVQTNDVFYPRLDEAGRHAHRQQWQAAVVRAGGWHRPRQGGDASCDL